MYYSDIGSKEEMKRRKKGKGTGNGRRGGERKSGIVQEVRELSMKAGGRKKTRKRDRAICRSRGERKGNQENCRRKGSSRESRTEGKGDRKRKGRWGNSGEEQDVRKNRLNGDRMFCPLGNVSLTDVSRPRGDIH
jgi:hypothetical protein